MDDKAVFTAIQQHASALIALRKVNTTVYQTWLQSLKGTSKQEWAQLIGIQQCHKGVRRRQRVRFLLGQNTEDRRELISTWDRRESLFVLCTGVTKEELINLNHLADDSFARATDHLSGCYNFAEAYRRALTCETRRVRERILERFECLAFYLNLVLGGFHNGTSWARGGHTRVLALQEPPDGMAKAKSRNERTAEKGMSYYCWGIFLGDMRNLIYLRADDELPESLFGDRHHRRRIPFHANQLFKAGLVGGTPQIQKSLDSIVRTWPIVPKTVALNVVDSLMEGESWTMLSDAAQQDTRQRVQMTLQRIYDDVNNNPSVEQSISAQLYTLPLPEDAGDMTYTFGGIEGQIQSFATTHESDPSFYQPPDLMHGILCTSFLKPGGCIAPSDLDLLINNPSTAHAPSQEIFEGLA